MKILIFGGKGFLGLEGGYRDLGEVSKTENSIKVISNNTGWDVAARGKISIGPLFGYAKAGAYFQKNNFT